MPDKIQVGDNVRLVAKILSFDFPLGSPFTVSNIYPSGAIVIQGMGGQGVVSPEEFALYFVKE